MGILESLDDVRRLVGLGMIPKALFEPIEQVSRPTDARWAEAAQRRVAIPFASPGGGLPSSEVLVVPSYSFEGRFIHLPDGVVGDEHDEAEEGLYSPSPVGRPLPSSEAYRAMHSVLTRLNQAMDEGGITHREIVEGLARSYPAMTRRQRLAFRSLLAHVYGCPDRYGVRRGLVNPSEPFQIFLIPSGNVTGLPLN